MEILFYLLFFLFLCFSFKYPFIIEGRGPNIVFPQLDYSEDNFFENVLENLAGRTKKEMSMLGQVNICKIIR
jgi:hypothetical protein